MLTIRTNYRKYGVITFTKAEDSKRPPEKREGTPLNGPAGKKLKVCAKGTLLTLAQCCCCHATSSPSSQASALCLLQTYGTEGEHGTVQELHLLCPFWWVCVPDGTDCRVLWSCAGRHQL